MTIKVDKEGCIGCGTCAAICSEVFDMAETDQGFKAVVKEGQEKSELPCVKESESACPVQAITIV
ncbi:ferredoxin [Candidatus Falkowbacteria bacterium CG10_big_fil_rev_8_21_14_0_10_39_11]|uniref:Ferredoxin n=1 Tax=Candidatus Falkowbacteria bacterium CG10_big_fil_rev_8_21_14_0_10_39_11 TaxID=1974565 RepID=A0A2H0V6F9_9BACT|nr:MAG: ferredoxin [Candidatus Falkowbacteria bacterium CG10_big_fil_rev_8_21_14_0_10_39_11]